MKPSISADIRALLVQRISESNPAEILRIAAGLAANEQIEAVSQVAVLSRPAGVAAYAPRFTNLDAAGKPTTGEHVAVHDRTTGLIWSRGLIASSVTYAEAMKKAAEFELFGKKCRAPTLVERFGITDFTKHSPAFDTAHFKKEEGWEWTSTLDASSPSGYAWVVYLGSGLANRCGQSYHDDVRAVLAGQNLSFGF